MDKDFKIPTNLEVARILGETIDPRKRYPDLVAAVCETDTAEPDEHIFYYDVLKDTDEVYSITTGGITASNVTPDTDAEFTFVDTSSPEFYVKLYHLATAKERVIKRKNRQINRALNAKEITYVVSLMATACSSSGNQITLSDSSGATRFNVEHLAKMIEKVSDYGSDYVLLVPNQIHTDIILWNWNDNKNIDIFATFEKLKVELMLIPAQTVIVDSTTTDLLGATKAYLVARNTNTSEGRKPLLFVRKKLNDIEQLGGAIKADGEKPERLIFIAPSPMNIGGTRYQGVGLSGYESIVCAVTNQYGICDFTRS